MGTSLTPLDFFFEISGIPRKSGDEQRVSDYLLLFAKDHGLECLRDGALTVDLDSMERVWECLKGILAKWPDNQ